MRLSRFLALLFVVALSSLADAQQPKKVARIGFLSAQSQLRSADRAEAFRQGLRELGYLEGKNIVIEYRWANGITERLPGLAAELLRLKVDIIVTSGGIQAVIAAKNATNSIPIVTGGGDVVTAGLVDSLSRPGGNVTGLTIGGPEVSGKRLEILKDVVPKLSRVAYIFNPTGPAATPSSKEEIGRSAQALGLQVQLHQVKRADEIVGAFDAMSKEQADALLVAQSPPISSDYKRIVDLTAKHRLPAIYFDEETGVYISCCRRWSGRGDKDRKRGTTRFWYKYSATEGTSSGGAEGSRR